jgi:tRNA(Arg) A34 adenosine deaminase TadA
MIISNIEPCPMCARAMAGALIQKVIFAVDSNTALRISGVKDHLPQSNALTFQSEYSLEYLASGPQLEKEALPLFEQVWERVHALAKSKS